MTHAARRPHPGFTEERNVDFLVNNGMAALITKHFPVDEAVYELFTNPVRLETVRHTMKAVAHPDATERLADFVLALQLNRKKRLNLFMALI